ncbi:MAG: ABC transporter ATP-binding protein [Chloroflexi bacterium]|nr:ABC transporter ATP-binding protein [Chloroflexota bacterium]
MEPIVQVTDLVKRYGEFTAVKGISFAVEPGECFGILGPNGAGKSSTLRILTAISPASSGQVVIDGLDVAQHPRLVKARLGVVPQEEDLDTDLPVLQNLLVYSRYFRMPPKLALESAKEALNFFELGDRAETKVDTLSGGMKRRLVIARAMLNRPKVLVLDEPTTGLDPLGRHLVWERLLELRRQGITTVLSTHNMEEATALCRRLVIIDHGEIIAEGQPNELVRQSAGREVVEVRPPLGEIAAVRGRLMELGLQVERAGTALLAYGSDAVELERQLASEGLQVLYRTANLEDVFLRLTGRSIEEDD